MHKQIGLYGLGVMGQSLARNIANKGFSISVFNIETDVTKACCQKYPLLPVSYTHLTLPTTSRV